MTLDKMVKLGNFDDIYHIQSVCEHGVPTFFDSAFTAAHLAVYTYGKVQKKSRFMNIPTFGAWGPISNVTTCVRGTAKSNLERLVRSSRQVINAMTNSDVKTFLLRMLEVSKSFVDAVVEIWTEEYTALTEHYTDDKLCWNFVCSCVQHVFQNEFESARSMLHNPDLKSSRVSLQVMWTALRIIGVQESFLRVGFKNHSSLASASSVEVEKMVETFGKKFESQETDMNDLKRKFKVVEGSANAALRASEKKSKANS
jgi:hypothetical protein